VLGLKCFPVVLWREHVVRLVYNFLFAVFFALSAPFYFLKMWRRGDWRKDFGQRFGIYSDELVKRLKEGGRSVVWMHAVSVGEVNICVPLLEQLAKQMPDVRWVVSTTTSTGMGELRRKLPEEVLKIYYPVDLPGAVARAWVAIRPLAVILVEAEIWPNFLWKAADKKVPVVLVNARMSDRSFRGYRRFGVLFRGIFQSLARVGAQSDSDRERWIAAGCLSERVETTGNMKFDLMSLVDKAGLDARALLQNAGIALNGSVIVAGSTHAGEERILGQVFLRLSEEFPDLVLILVPRHMERAGSVEREMKGLRIDAVRRSRLKAANPTVVGPMRCVIVDTTGELKDFYRIADIVFVGKSLVGKGGQNPIEPAAMGKPVLVGLNMQNFRDATRLLQRGGGLAVVECQNHLEANLRKLLENRELRTNRGEMALDTVRGNQGSVRKNSELFRMAIQTEISNILG
jgi:3-deoxy-D-manno-octulosonic-acid transferase